MLWALAWLYIGSDSPASHSTISEEEKRYVETLLVHSSAESSVRIKNIQIFKSLFAKLIKFEKHVVNILVSMYHTLSQLFLK